MKIEAKERMLSMSFQSIDNQIFGNLRIIELDNRSIEGSQ